MRFDINNVLKYYHVKDVFVVSGEASILNKIDELGEDFDSSSLMKNGKFPTFWCELSWGSGKDDLFDAAIVEYGFSLEEAFNNCLNVFDNLVLSNDETYCEIANYYKIDVK